MSERLTNKRVFVSDDDPEVSRLIQSNLEISWQEFQTKSDDMSTDLLTDYMARQVKEDHKRRKEMEAAEKEKEDQNSLYTKSPVHLLDSSGESSMGFQWVQSPYRVSLRLSTEILYPFISFIKVYMKLGPYQMVNGQLQAIPKQGHAYLSMEDCLNLNNKVSS